MESYLRNSKKAAEVAASKASKPDKKRRDACMGTVVCSLKELNKYREYLTHLKLDFQKEYEREQKFIEKEINKLIENRKSQEHNILRFQKCLRYQDPKITKIQPKMLRQRSRDMADNDVDKFEHISEKPSSSFQMREKEENFQHHVIRKLNLRKQIERDWKTKEMLLLTKIDEEVKREKKIEEQQRKRREEINREKQALLKKKIAHHLRKMQPAFSERQIREDNGNDDNTAVAEVNGADLSSQEIPTIFVKKTPVFPSVPRRACGSFTKPKISHRGGLAKSPATTASGGTPSRKKASSPAVLSKRHAVRYSIPEVPPKEVIHTTAGTKLTKKLRRSDRPDIPRAQRSNYSQRPSPTKERSCDHHYCQAKVTPEELNSIIENVVTWVVAQVISILYPAIIEDEGRIRASTCALLEDSMLASEHSSFCSTCSETLVCGPLTSPEAKTFPEEPCHKTPDRLIIKPTKCVGTPHPKKKLSIHSNVPFSQICKDSESRTCKSKSDLSTWSRTGLKTSKDAPTEREDLQHSLSWHTQAQESREGKGMKNDFVNFEHLLREETEVTLGKVSQAIASDLTEAIPSLSSLAGHILDDQIEADQRSLLSYDSISTATDDIVEKTLETLRCAVENKSLEVFSQDGSVHFKTHLESTEQCLYQRERVLQTPTLDDLSDVVEDMVHVILEREHPWFEVPAEAADPQLEEPVYSSLPQTGRGGSNTSPGGKADLKGLADGWLTRGNTVFKCKKSIQSPVKPAGPNTLAVPDWRLKTSQPSFTDEDLFKDEPSLNEDGLLFTQDETRQIQRASENIITCTLAEILRDVPSVSPGHSDQERMSHQEWLFQMFSVSEIYTVAQEIVDAVLKLLHGTLSHVIDAPKDTVSALVHATSLNDMDIPNEDPLEMWFQSKKEMKRSCSLNQGLRKSPTIESGEWQSTPEIVVDINDHITQTIFKRLQSFISAKLKKYFKSESYATWPNPASHWSPSRKSSRLYHLSAYATKVVNIVLHAIFEEVERNKRALNLWESDPSKSFIDTGFFANTEKELDSVATNLNNNVMASSLVACICEMLRSTTDENNVPLLSDSIWVTKSAETANTDKEGISGPSEIHQHVVVAQAQGKVFNERHFKSKARFQVLNRIEDTLYDMLGKFVGQYLQSPSSNNEENREWNREKLRMAFPLRSNIQLISNTILNEIITKLCRVEMDSIFSYADCMTLLEYFDADGPSFASLIEDVTRCTNNVSNLMSSTIQTDNQEVESSKARTAAPKGGITEEKPLSRLKGVASDILQTIFAILERFATTNLEILGILTHGKEKSKKMDFASQKTIFTDISEEPVLPALHLHSTRVAKAILKAIQAKLKMRLPSMATCGNSLWQRKELLEKLINFLLPAAPPGAFHETATEEGSMEKYRYRPTYGNFLPGGAEAGQEDPAHTKTECTGDEATSRKQEELEITLGNIEAELKEPLKATIVPIIRNILADICGNDILDNFNVVFPPQPHICEDSLAQTLVQFQDQKMDPLVSEGDIIDVATGVIKTIFQKLHSIAISESNANANRSSFLPQHPSGRKGSEYSTILCTCQSRFTINMLSNSNVVDDLIQSVLTNLETFTTSKIKSPFRLPTGATLPMASSAHKNETASCQPGLATNDPYSDQVFCWSGNTTLVYPPVTSILSIYATEVARLVLQRIKQKLDEQIQSPRVTHSTASESILHPLVSTTLDILSTRGKYEKPSELEGREMDLIQPKSIVEKLFSKTGYKKQLQIQIQHTMERILGDLCETTLDENNLQLAASGCDSGSDSATASKATGKVFIPEPCVMMMANEMVTIVLHGLRYTVMLGINAKEAVSRELPQTSTKAVSEAAEEMSRESCLLARKGKCVQEISVHSDEHQSTILKNHKAQKSAPDLFKENARFITHDILKHLKSFVLERIDFLIADNYLAREDSIVSPSFVNSEQDDSLFLGSHQMPSDENILKASTSGTLLSQGIPDHTVASCRQNCRPTLHISQASLKEHANEIICTILMLIKRDIDVEMQKVYPNNISSQENIVRETVCNILKIVRAKQPLKKSYFDSKVNANTKQDVQKKILSGQSQIEPSTDQPDPSKPTKKTPMRSKTDNQRRVGDDAVTRKRDPRPERTADLLSAIKEVLKKLHQRVIEDQLCPLHEPSYFPPESKFQASISAQRKPLLPLISSVASDIIESVFGKMFSIVMVSLYDDEEARRALDADISGGAPVMPSHFPKPEEMKKRSAPPKYVLPRVHPYTQVTLQTNQVYYSPVCVGKGLVQMVVKKLMKFALLSLEETSPLKGQSAEMQSLRLCSLRDNPTPGFKTKIKARSKVTSAPKCRAKLQTGPGGTKAKSKTKLGPAENTTFGWQPQSTDAKSSTRIKLPMAELNMHATEIVGTILETIMNEFETMRQARARAYVNMSPSDQILNANEMVSAVLQSLYITNSTNVTHWSKGSHSDSLKLARENDDSSFCFSNLEAPFSLENVTSQLEKLYPKEDTFKQKFDKRQTDSDSMENEKHKLLRVAEMTLNEISIKAKELEESIFLVNQSSLAACEIRCHEFTGTSSKFDTQGQMNRFSRKMVELLFEKVKPCFLPHDTTTESKNGSFRTNELNNAPIYNSKLKDSIVADAGNQIAQEIVKEVLHMLESFVDLHFKHVSTHAFSDALKMPLKDIQLARMKTILPKIQPLNKLLAGSKSRMISQENLQNSLWQLHSFHSELLTYTATLVNDMLGIIKSKLDRDMHQEKYSSVGVSKGNAVASEIVSSLMDQCTHFYEALIKNHPEESPRDERENAYYINRAELALTMEMTTPGLERVNCGDDSNLCYHGDDVRPANGSPSNLTPERKPSSSRNSVQDLSCLNHAIKGNHVLPEDSIFQKPPKKSRDSAEATLTPAMSFKRGEDRNQRALCCDSPKVTERAQEIKTTVFPLKLCLPTENNVNTRRLSYDAPDHPPLSDKNVDTIKLFYESKENPFSATSEGQKNKEKDLQTMWGERGNCKTEENMDTGRGSFPVLDKWRCKSAPKGKQIEAFEEVETIDFNNKELGPDEICFVSRHSATSVATHFNNFRTREHILVFNPENPSRGKRGVVFEDRNSRPRPHSSKVITRDSSKPSICKQESKKSKSSSLAMRKAFSESDNDTSKPSKSTSQPQEH